MDCLNCNVCSMSYNEDQKPVVLTCGHTFCKNCIDNIFKNHSKERRNCPTCKKTIYQYSINYALLTVLPLSKNRNYK